MNFGLALLFTSSVILYIMYLRWLFLPSRFQSNASLQILPDSFIIVSPYQHNLLYTLSQYQRVYVVLSNLELCRLGIFKKAYRTGQVDIFKKKTYRAGLTEVFKSH